jgi:hypothetical protein
MLDHYRKCKALAIIIAVLMASAFTAGAQTNTVSEPVGLVRITVTTNLEELVSIPFYAFDAGINAVFSNQLTGATNESDADIVRKWDVGIQGYTNAYKADNTGDSSKDGYWFWNFDNWATSTMTFYPGDGFWIKNAQANTQTVYLTGTVVLDDTGTVTLVYGFNLFSYPFSSIIGLNATDFTNDGAYGASPVTNADKITDVD